jgi:hypothetical protein
MMLSCRRFFRLRPGFALWYQLWFALWYQLRFTVPDFGMPCFADGCAGFRQSWDFEISISTKGDRSVALLAARTGRVVVARRRLSRISRRAVPAPASPVHQTADRLGRRWHQPTTTRHRAA